MGRLWIIWAVLTTAAAGLLASWLPTEDSVVSGSTTFLPGDTTHGHHQIEMKCGVCHEPGGTVREQSCLDCHEADLKASRDTHPRTKFIDPTKAVLLEKVDATNCLTCHTEHVETRTHGAGVTLPRDYCIHCHDTVADDRPSHAAFAFDSCTNAGCHNFHDNLALNENFLKSHYGEPDLLESLKRLVPEERQIDPKKALGPADRDAPPEHAAGSVVSEWASSAHALAGVNCSKCHVSGEDGMANAWSDAVGLEVCQQCHGAESKGFLSGLHGLRTSVELPPMTPELARMPMKHDALHRELDCNACHRAHADDTNFAAVDACLQCHDDEHSKSFPGTRHYELWLEEVDGGAEVGTGVTCATCHMPRVETSGRVRVQHNQSANLEPNTKMARTSCLQCHGLQFSLNALADPDLVPGCYDHPPGVHVDSLDMVRTWFESRGQPLGKK